MASLSSSRQQLAALPASHEPSVPQPTQPTRSPPFGFTQDSALQPHRQTCATPINARPPLSRRSFTSRHHVLYTSQPRTLHPPPFYPRARGWVSPQTCSALNESLFGVGPTTANIFTSHVLYISRPRIHIIVMSPHTARFPRRPAPRSTSPYLA